VKERERQTLFRGGNNQEVCISRTVCLIGDTRYGEVLGLRFCDPKSKENVPSGMPVGN